MLELTRNDSSKIVKRMGQLIASWDKDAEGSEVESADTAESGDNPSQFLADIGTDTGAGTDFATLSRVGTREMPRSDAMHDFLGTGSAAANPAWPDVSREAGRHRAPRAAQAQHPGRRGQRCRRLDPRAGCRAG